MQEVGSNPKGNPRKGDRKKTRGGPKTPPVMSVPLPANNRISNSHTPVKFSRGNIMEPRERAKADAVFASTSSQWYAGAAFDRSPDASTLPHPTRLLVKSPPKMEERLLATSCPSSIALANTGRKNFDHRGGTRTRIPTPPLESSFSFNPPLSIPEEEPLKSKHSFNSSQTPPTHSKSASAIILPSSSRVEDRPRVANSTIQFPGTAPPPPSQTSPEELEEMAKQVRRLLNIS